PHSCTRTPPRTPPPRVAPEGSDGARHRAERLRPAAPAHDGRLPRANGCYPGDTAPHRTTPVRLLHARAAAKRRAGRPNNPQRLCVPAEAGSRIQRSLLLTFAEQRGADPHASGTLFNGCLEIVRHPHG